MIGISRHMINEPDMVPLTKRSRYQQQQLLYSNVDDNMIIDCCQSTTTTTTNTIITTTPLPIIKHNLQSQDEILIEMIQNSNAKTYNDIVQFCLSSGIPMSRMLRLDLIRLVDNNNNNNT
jgi:hypothetical protein